MTMELFTNAPAAYDYHYVMELEARRCPFTGDTVRRLQVAIGCDRMVADAQAPRYRSGLYWVTWGDDFWPYKTPWGEMEMAR
jgi:hypothetical protein